MRYLQYIAILILPFFFSGIILKVKAFWGGRKGQPFFQPFFDFVKLLKKGERISTSSSLVFAVFPVIGSAAVLSAFLLVPLWGMESPFAFSGDFVLLAYLLAIGRFLSILGALDVGSSFEGMGASREASFAAFAEPAFFVMCGSLAIFGGRTSLSFLWETRTLGDPLSFMVIAIACFVLFVLLLTEGSRMPIDDPATHLELTMIHEVMVLDSSGPDLALIQYSAAQRMLLFASLIAALISPPLLSLPGYLAIYFGVTVFCALLVGAIESLMARLRMSHVPQFIILASALATVSLCIILFFSVGV